MGEFEQLQKRIQVLENVIFSLTKSDRYVFEKDLQFQEGRNVQLASGTGTKLGTATGQKLAFHGSTPVDQYEPTGATGFTDIGTGTEVTEDDVFTGGIGSSVYTIGDIVAALKEKGLIKS